MADEDPDTEPTPLRLAHAWQDARVREEVRAAEEALTRLRFHEGLRRGWAKARAEAAVREAVALASLEGVRTTLDDLRAVTMQDTGGTLSHPDPGTALALGVWRAQWRLALDFPPLNERSPRRRSAHPLPALLAGIHRDTCSALVSAGALPSRGVAVPVEPGATGRVIALASGDLPALAAAAGIIAEFRATDVFTPGSLAVGSALARWLLVERGTDPTGVAVVSLLDAEDPAAAGRALGAWMDGGEEGAVEWLARCVRGVRRGAEEGADVARRVQAGRLS
ncbi:MAG: hypothetical protein ACTJGR_01845 [Pauljensenia sp.]